MSVVWACQTGIYWDGWLLQICVWNGEFCHSLQTTLVKCFQMTGSVLWILTQHTIG